MKTIFIDSDVILDALLERRGFQLHAMNIIANAANFKLVTSSVVFVNVHYFLDKFDRANKFRLLSGLRSIISIIAVDDTIIDLALKRGRNDCEDAVQYYAALSAKADAIITRNIKDYKQSALPVLTPQQLLNTLKCKLK